MTDLVELVPPASHSFHVAFEQCPRKALHANILRDVERADSKAMAWGRHVHEAMEKRINHGAPLPEELRHYDMTVQFPSDYRIAAEVKLAIDSKSQPVDFFSDDVWLRGVLDVVVLNPTKPSFAILIDHKTGKIREDPAELEIHALLLQRHKPELTDIRGWFSWLAHNKLGKIHDLSQTQSTYERIRRTQTEIIRLAALGEKAFSPRQSGLCPWCPCSTQQCEYKPA